MKSPKTAVKFIKTVHGMVKEGKSVKKACGSLGKDRKTAERFQHIYYMYQCDKKVAKQVNQWTFYIMSSQGHVYFHRFS